MVDIRSLRTTTIVVILIVGSASLGESGIRIPGERNRKVNRKSGNSEGELMRTLLNRHDPLVRPETPNEPIVVSQGIKLLQIQQLDEDAGWITTNIWQTMEWNDLSLQWNPREFSNISSVTVPIHRIWAPDIVPLNNMAQFHNPAFTTKAILRSSGLITYDAPYIMTTSCAFKPGAEEQICDLNFGSWAHNEMELSLWLQSEDGADISEYTTNRDWELLEIPGMRRENEYSPEPSMFLTYSLKIKRRTKPKSN